LSFRRRLVVFLFATLALLQASTALFAYSFTRGTLVEQGKAQLIAAKDLFVRQLDEIGVQIAAGVEVLAFDFALRQAIAQRDHGTVLSALRNHGRRVGATRMLLVALDGAIDVDTNDAGAGSTQFGFPELIDTAAAEGRASSIVAIDGKAYWMVVVPVLAPVPIAFIAAGVPVDDQLLQKIQGLAALPKDLSLATDDGSGHWVALAGSPGASALIGLLPPISAPLPPEPADMLSDGREDLVLAAPLATPPESRRVIAVMGYPLAEALRQYQPIILAPFVLLAGALVVALAGALLIARSVARPVEALALATRRIEAGDYTPPAPLAQKDEIGQLSAALGSMARAISEREEHIRHQASHDAVTGRLNRSALGQIMAGRLGGQPAALLMVGFVRVQEIVKTVGREIADRLMRDAGNRLAGVIGAASLARISDSAFGVFVPGLDGGGAAALARRIVAVFEAPYHEGDLTIDAVAEIGIALAPLHGTEANLLLQRADVALFEASRAESRIAVYDPAADPHRPEHLSLMSDLRAALDQDGLRLFYQPKLDLASGRVAGAEALVRWQHPKRGLVPPDAFISLAEETGNIQRLTRWALASGITQAAAWRARGLALRVSVNLSVRDLADAALPERVAGLLDRHAVPSSQLMLEVTESAIMGEPDAAIAVLRRLADQGIALSIDDFGVGQSSLSYLRRLPVRELKIDKSFVLNLAQNAEDRTIVRSVIELGHRLGYSVTAEGVEDEAALVGLAEYGCDHAQGYHIARPLPVEGFDRFLDEARWPGQRLAAAS
jgi:predicted signal transduction protein with EAL and GGDEF domain